jgi:hypothetical protein
MKNKLNLIAAIFVLLIFSSFASATVTVPLNSGFDHWFGVPYGVSPSPVGLPKQEDYWINVSDPLNFKTSYAINKYTAPLPWLGPMNHTNILTVLTDSQWVNFQSSWSSAPGTNSDNPRYAIYRKCFCLQPEYKNPNMRFSLRADEYSAVYFNGSTNILLAPAWGNASSGPARTVNTTTGVGINTGGPYRGFKVGKNCLYVFVEDFGTDTQGLATGFNLAGEMSVSAGMLSMPAKGPFQSYAPCSCEVPIPGTDSPVKNDTKRSTLTADEDETEVIKEIIKFAEERRAKRIKSDVKKN